MKILIMMIFLFSLAASAHEDKGRHKHAPAWKRLPSSVEGVLNGKIREGSYIGVTHEFDPRQTSIALRLSEKKSFHDKDYIIRKSHSCELEVESNSDEIVFKVITKPIHYYEESPKQRWKRAPRAVVYQQDEVTMNLSVLVSNLQKRAGYPKNIGSESILAESVKPGPFTVKRSQSKVIEGGYEYLFLVEDMSFSLGVDKGGHIKFYNLHQVKTSASEVRPFDRYGLCFLK